MSILTEKVPAPTIKQQNTSPDAGRIPSPLEALENTISIPATGDCLVKVFIIDLREGDYNAALNAVEIIQRAQGMSVVDLIPWSLKTGHDYDVKEVSFTAKIQDTRALAGSNDLGPDQYIAFEKMSRLEIEDATKFIEAPTNDTSEEDPNLNRGLALLSRELAGNDYKLIFAEETSGEGTKAVLIRKKKIEEVRQEQVENTQQSLPEAKAEGFDSSKFITQTNITWDDLRNN